MYKRTRKTRLSICPAQSITSRNADVRPLEDIVYTNFVIH